MAGNYWFAYVIANNFLATKKLQLGPIIIFVIGLLNSMLFGSRGGAINMMIAFIACLGGSVRQTQRPQAEVQLEAFPGSGFGWDGSSPFLQIHR